MALYISYKCLSHPGAGKRGAVGWGSFMSYKWNYFGEMLRRPNLSAHVPLASSVWQGWGLHCLNLAEQLIGVAALMRFVIGAFPCACAGPNLPLGACPGHRFAPNRAPGELCVGESLWMNRAHGLCAEMGLKGVFVHLCSTWCSRYPRCWFSWQSWCLCWSS